jgi:hypothetical protein
LSLRASSSTRGYAPKVTIWPGVRLPVPPVAVWPVDSLPEGSQVVWRRVDEERPRSLIPMKALPDELYLRELRDLDLEDAGAILAFANEWGWLGDSRFEVRPRVLGEDDDEEVPYARFPALETGGGVGADLCRDIGEDIVLTERGEGRGERRHLKEFILYASVLRDLVRTWLGVKGVYSWDEVLVEWETPPRWVHLNEANLSDDWAIEARMSFFTTALDAALSPFRAHVQRIPQQAEDERSPSWLVSTYQAMALQLANHIAEDAQIKTCANESCRRLFVRQRGVSQSGKVRMRGLLYCSRRCAQTQAQREFRRKSSQGDGQ